MTESAFLLPACKGTKCTAPRLALHHINTSGVSVYGYHVSIVRCGHENHAVMLQSVSHRMFVCVCVCAYVCVCVCARAALCVRICVCIHLMHIH
jgi:hypothetical protein